ncbi:hypothetical protein [Trichothermofontia sp.]
MDHAFYATKTPNIDLIQKHRDNIAASLAHRLEVARANQNVGLVAQLEQEWQQLQYDYRLPTLVRTPCPSLWATCQQLWLDLKTAIVQSTQLSVDRWVTDAGEVWWQAHDPQTGKALYTDSEAEVVQWIEDHGLGR